jgi:hypothetical protein
MKAGAGVVAALGSTSLTQTAGTGGKDFSGPHLSKVNGHGLRAQIPCIFGMI